MLNVFVRADSEALGIGSGARTLALTCCLRSPRRGVFEVVKHCHEPDHEWTHSFVDAPELLVDRAALTGPEAFSRRLVRASLLGRVLAGTGVSAADTVSHTSAARLWGLPVFGSSRRHAPGVLELSHPSRSGPSAFGVRHRRDLPTEAITAIDVLRPDGARGRVRSTTAVQTVADLVRDTDARTTIVALEAFLAHVVPVHVLDRGTTTSGTEQVIELHRAPELPTPVEGYYPFSDPTWAMYGDAVMTGISHGPVAWSLDPLPVGIRRSRAVALVEALTAEHFRSPRRQPGRLLSVARGLSGSPLEAIVLLALLELGVSGYVQQHKFRDGTGRLVARVDFWFPEHSLVLEVDGFEKYGGPRAASGILRAEKDSQNRLADFARRVHRITFDDVRDARTTGLRRTLHEAGVL